MADVHLEAVVLKNARNDHEVVSNARFQEKRAYRLAGEET